MRIALVNLYFLQSCSLIILLINYGVHLLNISFLSLSYVICGIAATFYLLKKVSVPLPDSERVDRIFEWPDRNQHLNVIAHRACGFDAPENSLGALLRVVREGVSFVEFDVSLSSDGKAVVFHDDTLTRMTEQTVQLKSLAYEELIKTNISEKDLRGKLFPEEKIPSFDEFVDCCLEKNIRMIIDLKGSDSAMIKVILDSFMKRPGLIDMAVVSSTNPWVLYKIRAAEPKIVGCLYWRPYLFSHDEYCGQDGPKYPLSGTFIQRLWRRVHNILHEWLLKNFYCYVVGISAVILNKDTICGNVLEYWKKRGVRVCAKTVNLPSEKVYFERYLQIPYLTDTLLKS